MKVSKKQAQFIIGGTMFNINPKTLMDRFKIDAKVAKEIISIIKSSTGGRSAEAAMAKIDKLIEGYGVESLQPENAHVNSFWLSTVALYVNMGDTYTATIIYDTENKKWYLTTWGDFLEIWERKNKRW